MNLHKYSKLWPEVGDRPSVVGSYDLYLSGILILLRCEKACMFIFGACWGHSQFRCIIYGNHWDDDEFLRHNMLTVTGYSKVWCGKLALNLCRLTRRLYTISEARSEVDRPLVATAWDDGNKVDVQSHDGSLDRLHIYWLIGFFS